VRLLEHPVRLAHAGGEADVELETPSLPPLEEGEEVFSPRAELAEARWFEREEIRAMVERAATGTISAPRSSVVGPGPS